MEKRHQLPEIPVNNKYLREIPDRLRADIDADNDPQYKCTAVSYAFDDSQNWRCFGGWSHGGNVINPVTPVSRRREAPTNV